MFNYADHISRADGSRVCIALIHLCDSVCLPRDKKIKTAETKIAKLGTERYIYIRLLCFAVTEQLDMNIKSKKI